MDDKNSIEGETLVALLGILGWEQTEDNLHRLLDRIEMLAAKNNCTPLEWVRAVHDSDGLGLVRHVKH